MTAAIKAIMEVLEARQNELQAESRQLERSLGELRGERQKGRSVRRPRK